MLSITIPRPTPQKAKSIHLPGLNGLRAIAAIAVVVSHTTLSLSEFGLNSKIFGVDKEGKASGLLLAGYGVTIFFTLSGFLITYLLLREKAQIGRIKIKDFYIRRVLRIWPLYYLYLALGLVTIYSFGISFHHSSLPFYIFLAANVPFIIGKTLPFIGHYWSLGVEEQFYLFFPQIARLSNKKLFRISIALIGAILSLKFVFWLLARKTGNAIPLIAVDATRFHCMLVGVVGAIFFYQGDRVFFEITTNKITQVISWCCILFIALNRFHIASVIDSELVSLVALCLIMGQITRKNRIINLENKICDFIGKISYGIYVVHPLLIFFLAKAIGSVNSTLTNYLLIYLSVIAITVITAYLSYEFYEKRFLILKSKYSTVHSVSQRL